MMWRRFQSTLLTFDGRYPYIPPDLFSAIDPSMLEMLTMAALFQLSGPLYKLAALKSRGIRDWKYSITTSNLAKYKL